MLINDFNNKHGQYYPKGNEKQIDPIITPEQRLSDRNKYIFLKNYYLSHFLDIKGTLRLIIQVTTLLGDLHGAGETHNQITPETILIDPQTGDVSLLSGVRSNRVTFTEEELFNLEFQKSILPYLPPECTGRVNCKVDYRSDFYSLGVVFYELLSGKPPFQEESAMEMIHAHIAKVPQYPVNNDRNIPEMISDIVLKLLSKNPDDRYQSSWGLHKDLDECLLRLTPGGDIEPFDLGTHDMVMQFRRPSMLVGRGSEVQEIFKAYDRIESGSCELIMVAGEPGSGKTALATGIRTQIEERGGLFIYGKNEQSDRHTPYFSIIKAFQSAVKRLLSGSEKSVEEFREQLSSALTIYGSVITDVIPEIELITGPQPDLPDVGPEETRNRFKRVFGNFIRVFASQEHPLVIFLDDLHWADAGSFELIHSLLTESGIGCLLLIGTFRDNETELLSQLPFETEKISTIELSQLSANNVQAILEGFYKISGEQTWELAELIYNKTQGNPFFINQFIKNLYENNLFETSASPGWVWDIGSILKMQVTENVVDLLEEKINKLSKPVVELLKICSCAGNGFRTELISAVKGEDIIICKNNLTLAVTEGFLNYDYGSELYRFEHERIREIVYSMIDKKQKETIHHKIGQTLLLKYSDSHLPELIFSIVHHLKIGKRLLKTSDEMIVLLEFTIMAGEKARQANAYQVAADFFDDAVELLPEHSWNSYYNLSYRCYSGLAICNYLSLNFEWAEAAFNIAIQKTGNKEDKAYLYNVKAIMVANQGFHEDAVKLCIKGLRMLGLKMPDNSGPITLLKEIVKTRILLRIKGKDGILNLPELKGRRNSLISDLSMTLLESSFFVNQKLQLLVNLKMVQFFIKNGINDKSSFFFMTYSYFLIAGLNNYKSGIVFSELAINMNRIYKNAHINAKINMIHAIIVRIRIGPMNLSIKQLEASFKLALENGDFRYGMYAEQCILFTMFSIGVPLSEIEAVYEKNYDFLVQTRDSGAVSYNDTVRQTLKCIRGETDRTGYLDDNDFDEEKHIEKMIEDNIPIILQRHFLLRLMVLYIMGYYEESYEAALESGRYRESSLGLVTEDVRSFYTLMSYTGLCRLGIESIKNINRKKIKIHLKQLLKWAKICPENFLHKYLLVLAEISFLKKLSLKDPEGVLQSAEYLYGQAVQLAADNGFILDAAIASERAAEFYINRGIVHMARYYINEACKWYNIWGAQIKINQLEIKYSDLLGYISYSDLKSDKDNSNPFDYKAMVDSLQMISTEIILERLLQNLMKVIVENAGAERAIFISLQDDKVNVEAELNIGRSDNTDGKSIIINRSSVNAETNLLLPVINLVRRTGIYIVFDNAMEQGDFIHHPYVKSKKIKSLLCLPVIRQSEPIALLYLENNLAAGVFTQNRIKILQLLASQAAISFENARLYDRVSRKEIHLRMLSEKLRSLASELVLTEERERRKMAVELHDHLGHALANIRISLGMLRKATELSGDIDVFDRIKNLVDQSIKDVQTLTFELSPPVLYDLGLEGAIDWLAFNTAKEHGLTINYDEGTEKIQMEESVRAFLFRAVRELLFNIVKHAQAKNVNINSKRKDNFIYIEIEDDGTGFKSEVLSDSMEKGGGFGLFSIQERLALYGGRLDIQTTPGEGTSVMIVSPLYTVET